MNIPSSLAVYTVALVLGFVLMGFEMLGSRYLTPYFGSGIETWAALISTVLFAMMCGYFIGGWLADRFHSRRLLAQIIIVAGIYMVFFSRIADPALMFIMDRINDGPLGGILASVLMLFIPIALLGAYSPFAIRLLLNDLSESGRTAGMVYGISTLGNVLGTLITALYLIPLFGSRSLTLFFAALTCLSGIALLWPFRKGAAGASLVVLLAVSLLQPERAAAQSVIVDPEAHYPEGPLWHDGRLYYAEMTRDRVMVWESGPPRVFWRQAGCGPTSVARYRGGFLVLCHLAGELAVVSDDGAAFKTIDQDEHGRQLSDPNDSISDGKGGVYLTDPGRFSTQAPAEGVLYHLSAGGVLHPVAKRLHYPNGLAMTPAHDKLYLSEHLGRRILAFKVAESGELGPAVEYFRLPEPANGEPLAGPDGIEVLPDGAILFAEYGAGRVFSLRAGAIAASTPVDLPYVTNIAFDDRRQEIALTGAYTNATPPYLGKVMVVSARDLGWAGR